MTAREFWTRWRREIVRGTFLFAAVLAVGLLIISGVHRARSGVRDLALEFGGGGRHGGPRSEWAPWLYSARLGPRQTLWIRNVRGPITIESGDGDSAVISAVRTFGRSNPESVRFITGTNAQGVAVCAVWGASTAGATCEPGASGSPKGHDVGDNDVEVRFDIRLPKGVAADVQTVNGDVKATVAGPVTAGTVQGDVAITSAAGKVDASTVTGDVSVELPGVLNPSSVRAQTVTGDVSVALVPGVCAAVSGHTVTGDISTEFSVPVTGQFATHDMSGTIGKGGGIVRMETVTGDVTLNRISDAATTVVVPAPAVRPAHGAHPAPRARAGVVPPPPGKP